MTAIDLGAAGGRVADVVERLLAAHPSVPGVAVALRGPTGEVSSVVRGVADPATGAPLTTEHAYRIASCTKTFVAATVVALAVEGAVDVDAPAIGSLPAHVADVFARYEHAATVTIRQLLQHRSGLVDHTTFPEFGEAMDSAWTPVSQLAIAVARPALFDPGAAFSYSDSGYVVLGQLIEHLSGLPLAVAVRRLAGIDAAAVPSLHWEIVEPTPDGIERAHQLLEGQDTHDWPPTFDLFGGGGLVSTLPDLCRWWSDWFAGAHGSIERHLDAPAPTRGVDGTLAAGGDRVGLGVFGREVGGHTVWAHGGFWGLETGHVPDLGVSYALSITHRAAGVPAPHTVGTAVVSTLVG